MLYVGIDIAKHNHQACLVDQQGTLLGKSFSFPNTSAGADSLLARMDKLNPQALPVAIGMEATGHYWLSLYAYLTAKGHTVHVINPIQSDALRNLYIRQTKTDPVDAFIIAEVIRFGRFTSTALAEPNMIALRQLCRYRLSLVDSVSDIKRKIIAVMDQVFPEYQPLFSEMFGKASLELLAACTTPEEILAIPTEKLAELLNKAAHNRLGTRRATDKAESIRKAAESSFGVKPTAHVMAFQVRQEIAVIQLMESQLDDLDAQIASLYQSFDATLHTIPGVGPTLAAVILSEIGDINRFASPEKLVAFAGIDPSVQQSGNFSGSKVHMSKRGSPYLRRALWLAAFVAAFHDPVFSAFYQKKIAQGKSHRSAIGAVSRKLLLTVYALLKSRQPYCLKMPDDPQMLSSEG